MPRPPNPNAPRRPGRPARATGTGARRVEVWLSVEEDARLTAHLGRQAGAADVRGLALNAASGVLTRVRAAWRPYGVVTVCAPVAESMGEPWDVVATSYLGEWIGSFRGATEEEALTAALHGAPTSP